ncbi:MAG: Mur ligase family protein [Roseburia sp.]|nr:Mur ligase family protein [Anaeroplasma bactoclasticum]MCM1195554.1 Mur ligase family protein [Roseburia sp.]MCM1555969.1 Mur ligase family protein [Anaeroplasma bactoclasticum]
MLFYLIGIKGSALSALAKILSNQGHLVRGVDVEEDFYTMNSKFPIRIESFSNMKLKKCYFYIIGNAFINHSVTKYIKSMRYIHMTYPKFLSYHFKDKTWICISGTSGKTTATKMLATLLPNSTSLIGDGSYQVGTEKNFILESCEYRNTFLNYHPYLSLILNVNYDHVDFFKTKEEYETSFIQFAKQSHICIINGDEFSYRANNIITYGRSKDNDVVFSYDKGKVTILRKTFELPIVGLKYAYDYVGAYLVAKILNERDFLLQARIKNFTMPKRRFEKTEIYSQIIISDYAHHPQEIKTIYDTLCEQYGSMRKICIFEPHTISRLQYFIKDYKKVLSQFDECYLYGLFSSAREEHHLILEKALYKELGFQIYDYSFEQNLYEKENVIICFLGAGRIDYACKSYKENLNSFLS